MQISNSVLNLSLSMLAGERLIPVRSQAEEKIDWVKKKIIVWDKRTEEIERIQVH